MAKRTKDDSDAESAGSEADVNNESDTSERPVKKSKISEVNHLRTELHLVHSWHIFRPLQKKTDVKKRGAKPSKTKKAKESSESPSEGPSGKGNIGTGVITDTDGNKYVDLGKRRRITVRSFKGMTLLI